MVNMARAQKLLGERMGREVFMYSITLDPRQDTPQVLARRAELLGAKSLQTNVGCCAPRADFMKLPSGWSKLVSKAGDWPTLAKRTHTGPIFGWRQHTNVAGHRLPSRVLCPRP